MKLGRILPNLHGASYATRKLVCNLILSVILYGAPALYSKMDDGEIEDQVATWQERCVTTKIGGLFRVLPVPDKERGVCGMLVLRPTLRVY